MNRLEALKHDILYFKIMSAFFKDENLSFIDIDKIITDLTEQYNELVYAENILQLCLTGE